MTPDHEAALRPGRLVHDVARLYGHDRSALDLFRRARDVAEQRINGPLGVAVTAVLALAAYERADSPWEPSTLGASESQMALALAVLALPDGGPTL